MLHDYSAGQKYELPLIAPSSITEIILHKALGPLQALERTSLIYIPFHGLMQMSQMIQMALGTVFMVIPTQPISENGVIILVLHSTFLFASLPNQGH